MIDRSFIVPFPEVPSKHNLENLLPNLKAATIQTLDTILSLEDDDSTSKKINQFLDSVKELENISTAEEELIYECFLKLSKFEVYWWCILREFGFMEKHIFLGKSTSKNRKTDKVNFKMLNDNVVTQMAISRINDGDYNYNERLKILAYTIMAVYTGQYLEYEGTAEIIFMINYVLKASKGELTRQETLRWSIYADSMKSRLFYLECSTFFMNELKYTRDKDLISKVVLTRRSHQILYLRIGLFSSTTQIKKEPAASITTINKEDKIKLKEMLVGGFDRINSKYSEMTLEYLKDESLIKYFIKETAQPLICFYKVCHTIDSGYAEALASNLVYFSYIEDQDLIAFAASPYLRFVTRKMNAFKIVVNELIKRSIPFDTNNMFHKRIVKTIYDDKELSEKSLRETQCSDLRKIEYLVENGIPITTQRFLASIDENDKKAVLKIFMKLEKPKLLSFVYKYARNELIAELQNATIYSMFYVNCLNYLSKKGVDISTMKIRDDYTAYGLALKSQIKGLSMDKPVDSVFNGVGMPVSHMASYSNLLNEESYSANIEKSAVKTSQKEKNLLNNFEDGLFFKNSFLKVKNENSKFTVKGFFSIENSSTKNVFLKFDELTILYMKTGVVYLKQGDSEPEKIISLKKQSTDKETSENIGITEEYRCFRIKCLYDKKKLFIYINGEEHHCSLKRVDMISIDNEYNGTVSNLIYYRSTMVFHSRECKNDLEFYRMVVAPLQKLLKYRQCFGILLDKAKPFILNGTIKVKLRNIVEYKVNTIQCKY